MRNDDNRRHDDRSANIIRDAEHMIGFIDMFMASIPSLTMSFSYHMRILMAHRLSHFNITEDLTPPSHFRPPRWHSAMKEAAAAPNAVYRRKGGTSAMPRRCMK